MTKRTIKIEGTQLMDANRPESNLNILFLQFDMSHLFVRSLHRDLSFSV